MVGKSAFQAAYNCISVIVENYGTILGIRVFVDVVPGGE